MRGWRKQQLRDAMIRERIQHDHWRPLERVNAITNPRRIWTPEPLYRNGYHYSRPNNITLPRVSIIERYDEKGNPR